jgi:hypothetical protein
MDLAPITGIRALTLVNRQRTETALAPRFEIEGSARTGDETYSSSRQAADRGLEGEEVEEDEEESEIAIAAPPPGAGSTISFIA